MASLEVLLEKPLYVEPITRFEDKTIYLDDQRLDYASYFFLTARELAGPKPIEVVSVNRQADAIWDFGDLPSAHYKAELILIPVWNRIILKAGLDTVLSGGVVLHHQAKLYKSKQALPLFVDGLVRPTPDIDVEMWQEVMYETSLDVMNPYFIAGNEYEKPYYGSIDTLRFIAIGQAFADMAMELDESCNDCSSNEFDKMLRLRNKYEQVALANNAKAWEKGQRVIESVRILGICSC